MAESEIKSITILVVDDNDATRYMLSRALRQAGYQVVEAATGEEALQLVKTKPDLVTLDVHLPDINGLEICRRIKENNDLRAIPVIHISATFVQTRDKVNALNSGADGYLTHPVEDIVLIATVRAFLRARVAEKAREELLRQSRRDLENLEIERDLRERFVATLSHDLRSPMTAAKMSAQLILRRPDVSEAIQKLVGRVRDNIDRADNMIRDLLDANRIRAGEKLPLEIQSLELHTLIEGTLDDMASTHGDRFVFRSPGNVTGEWDRGAVQRVVENLATNGIKYGAPYRPITVTLADGTDAIRISVHNEGNPLSVADQANLFNPYSRTASALKSGQVGWGLGLTVVRGMVEAHGGQVTVESSAETGTVFTVLFPRGLAPQISSTKQAF